MQTSTLAAAVAGFLLGGLTVSVAATLEDEPTRPRPAQPTERRSSTPARAAWQHLRWRVAPTRRGRGGTATFHRRRMWLAHRSPVERRDETDGTRVREHKVHNVDPVRRRLQGVT